MPRPTHEAQRPLVDLAEGRDQDERGDLFLAFKRCSQWRKVTQTNLHVRELLFYVMATDRDRRGVQKSYAEIADRLELKDDQAARYVIARANEFGLLVITESRYQRGGQTANRYGINWPFVRAIRDGLESGSPYRPETHTTHEPGVTESQAGVTESQAGVTESHPYKEYSRTVSRTNTLHLNNSSPPTGHARSASSVTGPAGIEKEEEGCFFEDRLEEDQRAATGSSPLASSASIRHRDQDRFDCLVDAYFAAGVYSADALLGPLAQTVGLDHLEQLLAVWGRSAGVWGPGALALRLRRARPQLEPTDGWPPPRRQRTADIPITVFSGDPFRS